MLIMVMISSNLNWNKNYQKGILESDARGYYAYLPAIFIYKDLNFGFFDKIEREKYYNKNLFYDYRLSSNGNVIDKYYCGTALAELPFFLIAHLSSYLKNFDTDGYSKLYAVFVSIAALFYLAIGLVFLNATLGEYKINELHKSLTLLAALFGTNLFYYSITEPGMSHVYSFAFISMFFYYSKKYFSTYHSVYIFKIAVIAGVIMLIRPVNLMIFLVCPFTAGNFNSFIVGLKSALVNVKWFICSCIIFVMVISIQLIIYKLSTGHFFIYSYGGEGFNFSHPHIADILFSYKKGLFLYTPMYLLSLTGVFFLWKSSKYEFYSWAGFFILITYILSSWWMWFYGGSFSSRVYIEYIPVFMVLLALTFKETNNMKFLKVTYLTLVLLLIVVCQIQTYQYRYYQIHWSEMTKEKYWDVFLRVDKLIK
jgi:hypothetical protein